MYAKAALGSMEMIPKTVVVAAAGLLTVGEKQSGFPLTETEVWQYVFVIVAAVFASLATESSKRRQDIPFYAPSFWGNVGLGIMAGIAMPLLLGLAFEAIVHEDVDLRASVGLSILGAYLGRDALNALWSLLQAVGTLVAKVKGLQVSFKPPDKKGDSDDK